jgi:HJR/Mrr/RecB family endonuclease
MENLDYTNIHPIYHYESMYRFESEFEHEIRNIVGDCYSYSRKAKIGLNHFRDYSNKMPQDIITHYLDRIKGHHISEEYRYYSWTELAHLVYTHESNGYLSHCDCCIGRYLKIPYILWHDNFKYFLDKEEFIGKLTNPEITKREFVDYLESLKSSFERSLSAKVNDITNKYRLYQQGDAAALCDLMKLLLKESEYLFEFDCNPSLSYNKETKRLIVNYYLPLIEQVPNTSDCSITKFNKIYEDVLCAISLRSIGEVFNYDDCSRIDSICFNGLIKRPNVATGHIEDRCIISIFTSRETFEKIDLRYISPKECVKFLKGVCAAKLYNCVPIEPILTISKEDKRFVEPRNTDNLNLSNIAEMDWEDFEHLVRQIFEWEFNTEGSEVKITQASRDGGVDAIVFDPDPIRGGKIIIQAKRYTNTVGVSAVRDLYGTIINEGANKGILITTSDYGADSYKFAQGKPITLLNGGHLLYLLEKHGKKARIDLAEAKINAKNGKELELDF